MGFLPKLPKARGVLEAHGAVKTVGMATVRGDTAESCPYGRIKAIRPPVKAVAAVAANGRPVMATLSTSASTPREFLDFCWICAPVAEGASRSFRSASQTPTLNLLGNVRIRLSENDLPSTLSQKFWLVTESEKQALPQSGSAFHLKLYIGAGRLSVCALL